MKGKKRKKIFAYVRGKNRGDEVGPGGKPAPEGGGGGTTPKGVKDVEKSGGKEGVPEKRLG